MGHGGAAVHFTGGAAATGAAGHVVGAGPVLHLLRCRRFGLLLLLRAAAGLGAQLALGALALVPEVRQEGADQKGEGCGDG